MEKEKIETSLKKNLETEVWAELIISSLGEIFHLCFYSWALWTYLPLLPWPTKLQHCKYWAEQHCSCLLSKLKRIELLAWGEVASSATCLDAGLPNTVLQWSVMPCLCAKGRESCLDRLKALLVLTCSSAVRRNLLTLGFFVMCKG